MAKKLYTEASIASIAAAIRSKLGVNSTYTVGQMASAISQIIANPTLQEKTVTSNGVVTPDTGYDGLSSVIVNVATTVINADDSDIVGIVLTDSSGNEYIVNFDGNGEPYIERQISSIGVKTLPTTVQYEDGDTIDYTGLEVVGYYGDGTEAGPINNASLVFPVTEADADQVKNYDVNYRSDGNLRYSDSFTVKELEFKENDSSKRDAPEPYQDDIQYQWPVPGAWNGTFYNNSINIYNKKTGRIINQYTASHDNGARVFLRYAYVYRRNSLSPSYSLEEITSYMIVKMMDDPSVDQAIGLITINEVPPFDTMFTGVSENGKQSIPVKYVRAADNKELTASFKITVTEQSA